jgi:hypothetical protein
LDNDFLPGDPEAHVAAFVGYCNHQRRHESFRNLKPAMCIFRSHSQPVYLRSALETGATIGED